MNVPKRMFKSRKEVLWILKQIRFYARKKIRINKKYYFDFLNVRGVMPTDFLNCFEK